MKNNYFIHHSFNSLIKRLFDLFLALIVLAISLPIFIILWPLLLWQIGYPVIFKQKRTGKNEKKFTIFKFRTMVKNAESLRLNKQKQFAKLNYAPQPMFKIGDDPRFIKFGKFLSHSGLDELPQVINVIKGDMSLVGPRPLPIDEAKTLKKIDVDWYSWRHQVKPGLFSLWVLDDKRHQNLKTWKRLEKETLELNLCQQYLLILKISLIQLKNL
ncbi:MAG: sugar transferase [Patescibacteria group bacterium]|jgi:lipopolysaccharide/colanic/teichoic acid biosynthesis glycosyltransferase